MAVVSVTLEVNDKGTANVTKFAGSFHQLEGASQKAKSSVGAFSDTLRQLGVSDSAIKMLEGLTTSAGLTTLALGAVGGAAVAAAGMLIQASKQLMEMGDRLGDLSAKTTIGVEGLQRLEFAAIKGGTTLDVMTGAVLKMQRGLADSNPELAKLGLSIEDLKGMKPDEAFILVADAIRKIKDPADQAAAAVAIFGRNGTEMLPAIRAGLGDTADEAERLGLVLSGQTLTAAGDADDAFETLGMTFDKLKLQYAAAFVDNPQAVQGIRDITAAIGLLSTTMAKGKEGAQAYLAVLMKISGADQWLWAGKIAGLAAPDPKVKTPHKFGMDAPSIDFEAMTRAGLAEAVAADKAAEAQKRHASALGKLQSEQRRATEEHDRWLASLSYENVGKFKGPTMDDLTGQLQHQFGRGGLTGFQLMTPNMSLKPVGTLDLSAMNVYTPKLGEQLGASLKQGLSNAMKDLPSVIMGAIQGGGNVGAAVGSLFGSSIGKSVEKPLTDALGSALGPKLGGALGSMIPGIGAAVGPILGSLAGKLFGGLFGGEGKETNRLRDKFIESAGGIDVLRQKAAEAGIGLERLLAAKKVSEFDAAVKQLNGAMDEFASKQALQAEAHEKTREAFERYKIAVEDRGPIFSMEELHATAQQLLTDFTLMQGAGADMGAVMAGMSAPTSEWLNTMIRAGGEIPMAMKPMLQDMARAGELTKENGEAYTEAEVEGMSFAQTMTQMFSDLIKKLNEYLDALNGIPSHRTTTVSTNFETNGGGGGGEGDVATSGGGGGGRRGRRGEEAEFATGGTVWGPTHALIGEAGPEDIVPHSKRESYARGVLGGGTTINVYQQPGEDGEALANRIARIQRNNPGDLGRQAGQRSSMRLPAA